MGDSKQPTAFDLTSVEISKDAQFFNVVWKYEALQDYSVTDNIDLSITLAPPGGSDDYFNFTTFIGGGERIRTTYWGGDNGTGTTQIFKPSYALSTSGSAGSHGVYNVSYPVKLMDRLGDDFVWNAHVIYNQNGHDQCGTTEQSLPSSTNWLHYAPK